MKCQNNISYVIRQGDTLYNIAKHYNTTVENILSNNPHLNIYNLRVGELITFCIDKDIMTPDDNLNDNHNPSCNCSLDYGCMGCLDDKSIEDDEYDGEYLITLPELDLNNDMRALWMQYEHWTRMLIISIIHSLKNIDAITSHLFLIPKNVASLYRNYYGPSNAANLEKTISNHFMITSDLIKTVKGNDQGKIEEVEKHWYANVDKLAELLSQMNPYYSFEELQSMFHAHLDSLKDMMLMSASEEHDKEVAAYNNSERQAMILSDILTNGMINQFPDAFF